MKKTVKRILSLTLAALSLGSFSLGQVLHSDAESSALGEKTVSVGFTNVTGQMDASHIVKENFNSSVLESEGKTSKYETRTVIVSLSRSSLLDGAKDGDVGDYLDTWEGQRAVESISKQQNAFLSALTKNGVSYKLKNTYSAVDNAVAIEINTKYVSQIKKMEGVESVVISRTYAQPKTIQTVSDAEGDGVVSSDAVVNQTSVYKTGVYDSSSFLDEYDGSGMVVAILDTGLDYTHDAFQILPNSSTLGMTKTDVAGFVASGKLRAQERSALSGNSISANDLYVSDKIPFAYDYADDDADVYPSYSNHGTHVAGIVAGRDPEGYTNKDGEHVDEEFIGVAPNAQLVICKVFTDDLYSKDLGGAISEDILAALEDCITIGVDVINMSLGTSGGFTTTDDGDDEGEYLSRVYNKIQDAGISLITAASNDYSSAYGGPFGTNLASNPDSGTVGSPSTYSSAISVASISGQKSPYIIANGSSAVFYEESVDENTNPFDFADGMLGATAQTGEFEYVVVPGVGQTSDYSSSVRKLFSEKPRVALVKRGTNTFEEKVKIAMNMGAAGVIIYNNTAGKIKMNLGEIDNPVPTVSITLKAGQAMVDGATNRVGTFKIDRSLLAGPFMSDFSSWGTTSDLKLKPEITAHGGEITSTVPGGYDEQSGTSMASPNTAGLTALVRSYIEKELGASNRQEITRLTNQLMMSTATTVYDAENLPYSPRKQGAGLASLDNIINKTGAYLYTDSVENDYRPKIELGDDKEKNGEYAMTFFVKNFGETSLTFAPNALFMTETLSIDGLAVAEQAYILDDVAPVWKVNGSSLTGKSFSVAAGQTAEISVTLELSSAEKKYIDKNFKNGMYVEGFLQLLSETSGQCDLNLPFMGFYGDWAAAPMLDYTAFEISAFEQDASIDDDEKPQASVYATQAFASYYNETYIVPMGSYVYLLSDYDTDNNPMYANEDYCAVSRYNEYFGEGATENYMTTTRVQAVYAGLLRNARKVNYRLYNAETGELIYSDSINRVSKAYTSGGASSIPGNVKLEMYPDELGLLENGKYKMEFDFYGDYEEIDETKPVPEENTFNFSFYVDYQPPVLENANIRYYNYKEGNKTKQRIYLDIEEFDNHYAQSVMLCYTTTNDDGELVLQLATDYITPVRDAVKNGTSKVSIEITDLYEKYKDGLYIQLDDYALNNCIYKLNIDELQEDVLPNSFKVESDKQIELDIYETHKVELSYEGTANLSNFTWSTNDPTVAQVKNGEIVGLSKGDATITVSNAKGQRERIKVTVTDEVKKLTVPSISFGLIETNTLALVKAQGMVEVNPGKEFTLEIQTDPWYYPKDTLSLDWTSSNEAIVTVDEDGNVKTLKKGTASVMATIKNADGSLTGYTTSVALKVVDEFNVSGYTLLDYNGWGGHVVIPTDKNIMMIGEGAFEDNDNIVSIVIPETVTQIDERAFLNCTALKEVYFVSKEAQAIDTAKLSMINNEAFYGCTALELFDLSNTKTITLGNYCFAGCTNLKEVREMPKIGTMNSYAFYGCTSLANVDLSGLHMSGSNVFANCTSLKNVTTAKFTAIGDGMFSGCSSLSEIVLNTPKIGASAFAGGYGGSACTGLTRVTFTADGTEIGANAFRGCTSLKEIVFSGEVRAIGAGAFANTGLTSFAFPKGLQSLGGDILSGTKVTEITLSGDVDLSAIALSGAAFSGLSVKIAENAKDVYSVENGVIYNADKTKLLLVIGATEVSIPASVTEIAPYAFAGSKVESLVIPATVEKIGEGAFKNSALAAITLQANITSVEKDTFSGSKLTAITLPSSVEYIGSRAFANTPLLTFTFAGEGEVTMGDEVFRGCGALQEIALYDGISTMGNRVFQNCTSLTLVVMPSVQTLGTGTFDGAVNLTSVRFGDNATTLGRLTFANAQGSSMGGSYITNYKGLSKLTEVVFGDMLKEIGYGVFYNASALRAIDLKNVESVGEYAFAYNKALASVTNLNQVKTIAAYAFADCGALTALDLSAVETIGDCAFYIENGKTAYSSIKLESVKEIGKLAFYGGFESTVTLPQTLEKVGYGAFAGSKNLTAFAVAAGSEHFFVEDGALYRKLSAATYEMTAYPTAKAVAETDGTRVYKIKEGTIAVLAYAFAYLNEGVMDAVVLPYSVKVIGDSAFYQSGVTTYTFESIVAPTLENIYRADVCERVETESEDLQYRPNGTKGFYYANFEDYLYNYTDFGGKVSPLTVNYPENGVGYDNYVYETYFKTKNTIGVLIEDYTRECKELIESFDVALVKSWNTLPVTDENKLMVSEFSESVKLARLYYNNIKNEAQLAFLGELGAKLTEVETELRAVKARFGIAVKVSKLTYEASGYRSEYVAGETFVMDGLKVTVVYDDNSSELADISKLSLLTTKPLTEYDRYVEIQGYGKTLRVSVTVTPNANGGGNTDGSVDGGEEESGCGSALNLGSIGILAFGAAAFALKKRKERGDRE